MDAPCVPSFGTHIVRNVHVEIHVTIVYRMLESVPILCMLHETWCVHQTSAGKYTGNTVYQDIFIKLVLIFKILVMLANHKSGKFCHQNLIKLCVYGLDKPNSELWGFRLQPSTSLFLWLLVKCIYNLAARATFTSGIYPTWLLTLDCFYHVLSQLKLCY